MQRKIGDGTTCSSPCFACVPERKAAMTEKRQISRVGSAALGSEGAAGLVDLNNRAKPCRPMEWTASFGEETAKRCPQLQAETGCFPPTPLWAGEPSLPSQRCRNPPHRRLPAEPDEESGNAPSGSAVLRAYETMSVERPDTVYSTGDSSEVDETEEWKIGISRHCLSSGSRAPTRLRTGPRATLYGF